MKPKVRFALRFSDVNSKLLDEWTALHLAADRTSGGADIAALLVERQAEIDAATANL